MFVSTWHLYLQKLWFCICFVCFVVAKQNITWWWVGAVTPAVFLSKKRRLKGTDGFLRVWAGDSPGEQGSFLASRPRVYRSLYMLKLKRNSFGLYPDSDSSVIFDVNKLSSFVLPLFLYAPEHLRPLPSCTNTVSLWKGNSSLCFWLV